MLTISVFISVSSALVLMFEVSGVSYSRANVGIKPLKFQGIKIKSNLCLIIDAAGNPPTRQTPLETRLSYIANGSTGNELLRSMIDHKKVLVMALNGGAVGGGCAWFLGSFLKFAAS